MPPWLFFINSAQRKESRGSTSRWVQLATVGIDNTPRVRTVVFRGWSKYYEMEILTDKRSQKSNELNLNNNVEICWFFSKAKCQFRLRGKSAIDSGKDTIRHWNQLTESSKSMWSWPSPGDSFVSESQNELKPVKKGVMPDNFTLIKIKFNHVDLLTLNKPMHIRKRWILNDTWIEERLNP
tara:strand:+ start:243 stop:785 length:543 start_codon:yes stop_codon:yes gene_type:complete